MGNLKGELKVLKVRRDELLGGVEGKEAEVAEVIEDVEEKMIELESKNIPHNKNR